MPISIRMDQTVRGFAHWTKASDGTDVPQVNPITISSSDTSKVTVTKESDGGITLHPVAVGTGVTVSVADSAGKVVSDAVTVTAAQPPVGRIDWGTPTPA